SLVYSLSDSSIRMFAEPVLWSSDNQMTARFISIKTADGKIDNLNMDDEAFIISQEDSSRYNQIKGKNILATFKDDKIYRVDVKGNGETVYFTREDDDGDIFGINKATSRDLLIFLKDNVI